MTKGLRREGKGRGLKNLLILTMDFSKFPRKQGVSILKAIHFTHLCRGVYQFTATINAETYERVSSTTQRLRPAAWAIVKKGEEDKVS